MMKLSKMKKGIVAAVAALSLVGTVATCFAGPVNNHYSNAAFVERKLIKLSEYEVCHIDATGVPYGRGVITSYEHFTDDGHAWEDNIRRTPDGYTVQPINATIRYTTEVDQRNLYTGAIIDCRGLGLTTAKSPIIEDAVGRHIFGSRFLNYDEIIADGMVGYANGFGDREALSRAGSNPIILKAIGVRNNGMNPVIDQADGSLLIASGLPVHSLDHAANVVFVR